MPRMNIYDDRNSPAAARVTLSRMKNTVGQVPALAGVLAGGPGVLNACTEYAQNYMHSSLNPEERMLVLLVAAREFGNDYCFNLVMELVSFSNTSDRLLRAARERRKLRKKTHRALADFVCAVVNDGAEYVRDEQFGNLRKAGFSDQQVLEIIMGISVAWIWSTVSGVAGLSPAGEGSE